MTISAPCPPWSGAGKQEGLNSDIGCLLPTMILRCRQLRPLMILLEQVNAFATHEHKRLCLDLLKHVGYKLVWQRVVDSAEFGSVTRLRWLALAVHRNAQAVDFQAVQMWPKIEAAFSGHAACNHSQAIARCCTVGSDTTHALMRAGHNHASSHVCKVQEPDRQRNP